MTRSEAEKRIKQAEQLKDILERLVELDYKFSENCENLYREKGTEIVFNITYEAGDKFVEDRILDILRHLQAKYERQLKDFLND